MSAAQRVPGLSVVLPAYNEEPNIVPPVEQALGCLPLRHYARVAGETSVRARPVEAASAPK
jgi:hypothetical protein